MYVFSNRKLIETRSTLSGRLMLAGFGLILGSAVLTFLNPTNPQYILPAYTALIGGFIIFNIGAAMGAKWRLQPRPDQALARALKGLDNYHRLYNFLLPADHVLLTPTGIAVFQVRRLPGIISCNGDKWYHKRSLFSRLRFAAEEQVGNPTADVLRDLQLMRQYVNKNLGRDDIPIDGMILFSHPSVQLTVTDPVIPVLTSKDIKDFVRQISANRKILDPDTYDAIADLFDAAEGIEEAPPSDYETPIRKTKAKPRKGK